MHAAGVFVGAHFGWQPEIRGIVVVLIAVGVLMGIVYLLLATNLGARLGLLVALGALFGWLTLMASIWWIYGIGLKGADPTWKPVEVIVGDISNADQRDRAANLDRSGEAPDRRSESRPGGRVLGQRSSRTSRRSSPAPPTTSSPTCTRSAVAP